MAKDEHTEQNQQIARSRGIASLVFFGIFIMVILIMISNAPGGWAWGYGIIHLLSGFVIIPIGLILSIRGITKHSKSGFSIAGLILNGIVLICLLPIAPLGLEVIGEIFSSGKPSPTDRAWYLMESTRVTLLKMLPSEDQAQSEYTYRFLEAINSKLSKNEGREIEKIIVQFQQEAGVIPDSVRSQKVINSLSLIAAKHEDLKPWFDQLSGIQKK